MSGVSHFSTYLPYDARIARFVAKGLREQAYAVDVASTGDEALYQAAINLKLRK
jgi:DNA-binding response OmpR family regulator